MRSLKRITTITVLLMIALIFSGMFSVASARSKAHCQRAILFYGCGSDLEDDDAGYLSGNLRQIMNAPISQNTHFIVMLGGSRKWDLEAEYLDGADQITINEDQRHQIWECSGADGNGHHGKMRLLGTIPEVVTKSMSDPDTLKAFIDYCVDYTSADKYNLICWDHGGGPAGGFGLDNLDEPDRSYMKVGEIASAIKNSAVVQKTPQKKFEFIDFDACMMGNAEVVTALAPYTDYFIGSAEVEPAHGQEYTPWLNLIFDSPNTDGYLIGKKIVDSFYDFYNKEGGEWCEYAATLSVINTENYRKRLLPQLKTMTGILHSEAFEKGVLNQKYNFYDELNTDLASIYYGSHGEGLLDAGDFAGRIGICLAEDDNMQAGDLDGLKNRYTESAVEIRKILADRNLSENDVIYTRWNRAIEKQMGARLERDENGELTRLSGPAVPSGLSFLLGENLGGTVQLYVESMNEVCRGLDDALAVSFLDDLKKTALEYAMVAKSGCVVSELASGGQDTGYEAVMNELKDPAYNIDPHIELAKAEGLSNVENWLREIIEQHASEVLKGENISVQATKSSDGSTQKGYYITINGSSLKVIDSVSLQRTAGFRDLDGQECMLSIGSFEGQIAQGMMIPGLESGEEPLAAAYKANYCAFEADEPGQEWYELSYDGGKSVITLDPYSESKGEYVIPVSLKRKGQDYSENGCFEAKKEKDGSLTILGFAVKGRIPQPTIPIDNDSLDGASFTLLGTVFRDGQEGGSEEEISGPIALKDETGRGLSIVSKPLSEISSIDSGRISAAGEVQDIFYYSYDITDKLREADRKAGEGEYMIDITSSDPTISVPDVTYDGKAQKPPVSVTVNGESLSEGVDFKAFYYDNVNVGDAYVVIYGIGKYYGADSQSFKVKAKPAADISKLKVTMKTSATYTGKAVKPAVRVSGLNSSGYSVTYQNNVKVGTGKVIIKGRGGYTGTITKTFKILPKKAVIAKTIAGKRKVTVRMKTKAAKTGGSSYEIRYRVKGSSRWKTVTTGKQSVTIRKLKKGKKYQIQSRAFRKAGGVIYRGPWSKVKTAKV